MEDGSSDCMCAKDPPGNFFLQLKAAFVIFRTQLPQMPVRCPSQNSKPGAVFAAKRHDALPQENQSAMSEKRTDHFKLSERKRVFEMVC